MARFGGDRSWADSSTSTKQQPEAAGQAPWQRSGTPQAGALSVGLLAVTAITNKSLRALMTGLLGEPYPMNRASYDLTRLRRNGLLTRIPGSNRYQLTDDGLAFAIFYTKVHNRILRPLLATQRPQAPPPLRAAFHTIDQHINARLAEARLPQAAARHSAQMPKT